MRNPKQGGKTALDCLRHGIVCSPEIGREDILRVSLKIGAQQLYNCSAFLWDLHYSAHELGASHSLREER